jgi:hypothetical protein
MSRKGRRGTATRDGPRRGYRPRPCRSSHAARAVGIRGNARAVVECHLVGEHAPRRTDQ